MIYKGKVDWYIGLAVFGGMGAAWLSVLSVHQWPALAIPLLFTAFVFVVLFPQRYEIAFDGLRVCHGLMTRSIPWASITTVSVSSESRSSLALSLDRVLVEYTSGSIMIAPDDQARFFDDIASHCPQLSRRGMDLVIAMN